ncbi:cytochrome P450 [Streptomyces sp. NPDC005925]|uniref:cytochrome P450 n=1 Tax=Streptomyces sp. NPDC005925 TaxID=3157172 RepID=UPI0033C97484
MLDVFGDYSARDPFAALADAVQGCPYQAVAENGGPYALRAADVRRLLTSGDVWSQRSADRRLAGLSERDAARRTELKRFLSHWPVFSDSEYHQRARRTVVRLLRGTVTPELVAACTELFETRLATPVGKSFDWLEEVARPTGRELIATLVGRADAARLIRLSGAVMDELAAAHLDIALIDHALEAVEELRSWLEAARNDPPTPFVAKLGKVWDDPAYGPEPATAFLTQMITGAYDPTTTALCVVGERVGAQVLLDLSVTVLREEVFRLATPFRFATRYARQSMSVGPYRLEADDRINLCLGTANLDPAEYPDPLEIRARENAARALSFGAGKHYCPGALLARTVVEALLTSLKKAQVVFDAEHVEREPELPALRYRKLRGSLVPAV